LLSEVSDRRTAFHNGFFILDVFGGKHEVVRGCFLSYFRAVEGVALQLSDLVQTNIGGVVYEVQFAPSLAIVLNLSENFLDLSSSIFFEGDRLEREEELVILLQSNMRFFILELLGIQRRQLSKGTRRAFLHRHTQLSRVGANQLNSEGTLALLDDPCGERGCLLKIEGGHPEERGGLLLGVVRWRISLGLFLGHQLLSAFDEARCAGTRLTH
jgi:hypothetical protein